MRSFRLCMMWLADTCWMLSGLVALAPMFILEKIVSSKNLDLCSSIGFLVMLPITVPLAILSKCCNIIGNTKSLRLELENKQIEKSF